MERQTYWNEEFGCWTYRCTSGDAARLLAAYEDTDITPEQIKVCCKPWNKFVFAYDEELQKQILQTPLPEDEQEILVTDGKNVWQDTYMTDGEDCWLDNSGSEFAKEVTHWMPLPTPPKEDNNAID